MSRRVVIDPAGSPRQVPPTPTAARRRRGAESTRRDVPAPDLQSRDVPTREVPRREVPLREVPRRDSNGRRASAGTPAEELIRRAAAGREAIARQAAAKRATQASVRTEDTNAARRSAAPKRGEDSRRAAAPARGDEGGRRSVGRHTGEHANLVAAARAADAARAAEAARVADAARAAEAARVADAARQIRRHDSGHIPRYDSGELPRVREATREVPRRHQSGEVPIVSREMPRRRESTGQHAVVPIQDGERTGTHRTFDETPGRAATRRERNADTQTPTRRERNADTQPPTRHERSAESPAPTRREARRDENVDADQVPIRRERTWRDGPREDAAWRDTARREAPRRRRREEPDNLVTIDPAGMPLEDDDDRSATVLSLDSAPRRRADRRSVSEDTAGTTTTRALAALGITSRRRNGNRELVNSSHREGRNRPATSRDGTHTQDIGPRRHRRLGQKRIGIGLAALVTIAVGATIAAGFAINNDDEPTKVTSAASSSAPCNQTGPGQRQVEAYLATRSGQYGRVEADGRQSPTDCAAIASFQRWAQVPTQSGFADATTGFLARRLGNIRYDQCQAPGDRMTVCVDLTNQAVWVVQSGRIVLGPTTARTGRSGNATPTGQFTITQKKVQTVSTASGTPLPYWERFVNDIGFYTADSPMYSAAPGTLGGVTLLDRDAKALYGMTEIGTSVTVFGTKPGT